MRLARKMLHAQIVRDFNVRLVEEVRTHRADLLFVFKGSMVAASALRSIRDKGCLAIQFYPDVSFRTHGGELPDALKEYDWVFTTKTFGLKDMREQLGVVAASFLPHGYDPETHRPVNMTRDDVDFFGTQVSFVGNWSPKKQRLLEHIGRALPRVRGSVWGPPVWRKMPAIYRGQPVLGLEYSKAISQAKINLAPLSEQRVGASSGDQITSRTFHIPAVGGFMLHERTDEAISYFEEGKESGFYGDADEAVRKIRYYLSHPKEREAVALAGHERCLGSGYSVDDRATTILEKYYELRRAEDES